MISIVLDTNILFSNGTDFTKAQFYDKVDEVIGELESNDLYDEIQILIPQIVIDELFVQQMDKYNESINKIRNLKLPNVTIGYLDDYEKFLRNLFSEAIKLLSNGQVRFKIIDYPQDIALPYIISRAIRKGAPFEGKEKASDKGFKDVILWESLLLYKQQHATDTMILFSKDERICHESLCDEYRGRFRDDVHLIRRKNENDNKVLYDKISELTNKKITLTFSDQLNQQLLDLITNDSVGYLFENEKENRFIDIFNKSIKSIDDVIDENQRIRFVVEIEFEDLSRKNSEESYSLAPSKQLIGEFNFEYSFEDNKFYLRSNDGPFGYCEYISDKYELS